MIPRFPIVAIFSISLLGILCYGLALSGVDAWVAKAVYLENQYLAWQLRQYGLVPVEILAVLALVVLLIGPLRKRYPRLRHASLVYLATMLLGVGLLNQVILQDVIDRPRPRDAVLVEATDAAALSGHSFPGGHAGAATMLIIPFFALWSAGRRKLALTVLSVGLLSAGLVGGARMVLGAHYLSDTLFALGLTLWCGTLAHRWIPLNRDIPTYITGGIIAVAVLAIVLGNSFRLNLTWQEPVLAGTELTLTTPCDTIMQLPHLEDGATPKVQISLTGYGAPLSQLTLQRHEQEIYLQRWRGLYHSLTCQATIWTPPGITIRTKTG